MIEPTDCVGAGGCLATGAAECAAAPCNAGAGPVASFTRQEDRL